MTEFLKDLMSRMEAVQLGKQGGPDRKVEERDHVVGVMSDGLKRLWGVRELVGDELNELKRKAIHAAADAKSPQDLTRRIKPIEEPFVALSRQLEVLSELFWASVRHEFLELAAKSNIGVREKWQVAWTEEDPHDDIADLLAALGGGRAHLIKVVVPGQKPRG